MKEIREDREAMVQFLTMHTKNRQSKYILKITFFYFTEKAATIYASNLQLVFPVKHLSSFSCYYVR